MYSFNKSSLYFLERNFYPINAVQITIVGIYLFIITTTESLPWIIYGIYAMLISKMISCIVFHNITEDFEMTNTLIPFKYMALFIMVYFIHAVFFLGVQFALGRSILCLEVMWNIILTLMFMAATPLN
jgi:hypothetical protein